MAEFQFTPTDGFKNKTLFPNPSTEDQARAQVQSLLDQLRDAVNVFHGTNGAENIGIPLSIEGSGVNLKQRVEWLYTQIANAILNQVADDSVKDIKLSNDPADIKTRFTAFVNTMTELTSELSQRLDRNSYDDYQLWLELYYKGTISHVEADNAKAIMFDGFADKLNVDTINSTVTVDTTNKKVTLENMDIKPNIVFNNNNPVWVGFTPAQTFTVGSKNCILKKIGLSLWKNNVVSGNLTAYILNTDTYGVPFNSPLDSVTFSASSVVSISDYNTPMHYIDFSSQNITLQAGKKYAIALTGTMTSTTSGDVRWNSKTSSTTYSGGSKFYNNTSGISAAFTEVSGEDFSFEVEVGFQSPSTLITDPKAIPFLPTSMKLYQSVKKPAGTTITTTISANGGTNYETPTLVSSRPDPKFTGYTEEEYDLTIANVGQSIKLKSVLTGANRDEVEIKRYGLIIS